MRRRGNSLYLGGPFINQGQVGNSLSVPAVAAGSPAVLAGTVSTSDTVTAATVNHSHTVPSGATYLCVAVHSFGNGISITGLTYSGNAMTVYKTPAITFRDTAICYLANPPAGTANVVISFSGTLGSALGVVGACFTTSSPGAREDEDLTTGNPTTSLSRTVTAGGDNRLVVGVLMGAASGATSTPTGTGHVKAGETDMTAPGDEYVALSWAPVGSGDYTLGWTLSPSGAYSMAVVVLP